MMTYQEWLKIVEGTEAMRDVARRLGLGDSDMHRALEALMPATMMNGFAQTVFGAGRPPVGNPFESFFASPEIKRAVAKQAAALSGMNETFFNDIMPAFASGFATAAQQFSNTASSSGSGDASGQAMGEAIGGMMANNSCGARSVLYGKTIDHVLEQTVLLADGSVAHFRDVSRSEMPQAGLEGKLYETVTRLASDLSSEIEARYPKVMRRVMGYNLDEFTDSSKPVNLAKLMVGSEGTLGFIAEAALKTLPELSRRYTGMLYFQSVVDAASAVAPLRRIMSCVMTNTAAAESPTVLSEETRSLAASSGGADSNQLCLHAAQRTCRPAGPIAVSATR